MSWVCSSVFSKLSPSKVVNLSRCLSTSVSKSSSKVYELRTYAIKPECLKEFLNLTSEKFHIRTRASVLHGYWTVELGGINQVVHLWEYDNFEHRASVRASLAKDGDWIGQYFGKIVSMFQSQENMTLNSLPGRPIDVIHPQGKGAYELWQFKLNQGVSPGDLSTALAKLEVNTKESVLCGAYTTLFGPGNSAVLLWRHSSLDVAQNLRENWQQFVTGNAATKSIDGFHSKALTPISVSPMQ